MNNNTQTKNKKWSVENATEEGRLDILKTIIKESEININDIGKDIVICACRNGHLNIIKYVVREGFNIKDCYSGLLNAIRNNYIDIAEFMIKMVCVNSYESSYYFQKAIVKNNIRFTDENISDAGFRDL